MDTTLIMVLQSLGLTPKEIDIYLQSLKSGPNPASILGKRTGINRSTAQYICQSLTQKRLLSVIQKNNSYIYSPEPPEKLKLLLGEEKKIIEKKESALEKIIGDLTALQSPHINLPKVKYFQGSSGIIEMFDDVLKDQKPIYGATRVMGNDKADPVINKYLKEVYIPARTKNKTPAWMLYNDNPESLAYRQSDPKVNRISLLVPTESFPFEVCFHVYGDKIAFYAFKLHDSTGIIIENTFIKTTMLSLFKMAWDRARRLEINRAYRDVQI